MKPVPFALGALLLAAVLALPIQAAGPAPGWAQFRGPARDGISPEAGLLQEWPKDGPKLAWKLEGLGKGFSSVALADGKLFTMGDRGDDQFVLAFDLATQKELWATKVGAAWKDRGKEGPRCTPTVDGERVYALGTHGDLVCLETASGKEVFRKSLPKDFNGKMMSGWGFSESPLVDGDRLLITPGAEKASIVALDKKTGATLWQGVAPGKARAAYASIVQGLGGGQTQYIAFLSNGLAAFAPQDGKLLWSHARCANGTANCTAPLVKDNWVFGSSAYNTGSSGVELVKDGDGAGGGVKAEERYFLDAGTFSNHHGGLVLVDGHIYGGDGQNKGGPTCLELKTGKVLWKEKPLARGSAAVIYADARLYYYYEDGTAALLAADPSGLKVHGQFKVPSSNGPHWAQPAILDGKLYLRDHDVLYCYDIKK